MPLWENVHGFSLATEADSAVESPRSFAIWASLIVTKVECHDQRSSSLPSMGTLVIRTWREADQTPSFRARITYGEDPSGEPRNIAIVDPDKVLSVVRQWLSGQTVRPDTV